MKNGYDHITDALIISYLSGDPLPDQSIEEIEDWLEEGRNKLKAREIFQLWELSLLTAPPTGDPDSAYLRLQEKLKSVTPDKRRVSFWGWSVAASILLISGFALWSIYLNDPKEIYITKDQKQEVDLEDGSIVSLNVNTQISFSRDAMSKSDTKREIHLIGEAFFDVSYYPQRPFLVHTSDAEIKVLGTKFLVKAPENSQTVVLVTEGIVQVTYISSGEKVILQSNEEVLRTKDHPAVVQSSDENQLYWKTGVITFQQDSLGKVFQILQQEFDQPLVIKNPAILSCNLTATFKKQSLETIIKVIKTTHKLETRMEDGKIIIDGEGCD